MTAVRVRRLGDLGEAELQSLHGRCHPGASAVMDKSREIIESVRRLGDEALSAFTAKFDGIILSPDNLRVKGEEFDQAEKRLPTEVKRAVDQAIANIRRFHEGQVPREDRWVETQRGVWCGERWTSIDSVCLYVPRGRGSFPSVACMLGVPAQLAGVRRTILCTPPGDKGEVDPATLYAAAALGIKEVYRIGGAQAVAAAAYGTQSVPRCAKFVGPGNVYVEAARMLLRDVIDPGPPAGPSEALILCDESANHENAAWNLLIEAEHGENSTAVLVTHVPQAAPAIADAVARLYPLLSPQRRAFAASVLAERGGILITDGFEESIQFANAFAAEHVALMVAEPWDVLPTLTNAGEIVFGGFPIISLANYAMGVNAILPTGGRARTTSGVSVQDFLKRTALGFVTESGFRRLRDTVPVLSRYEGFSAHHEAIERWRVRMGR